jgi:streptomycin 6-kinase
MLGIFRAHLKPVAGRSYQVEDCLPFRFRCRQSTSRCVLQYTLRLVERETGRRWDQWVTGLVYAEPGAAERLWRQMRADEPHRDIPECWLTFQPVAFIPDLQMVVQVFPYDRRLRNLSAVMGGASRRLEPLLLARLGPGQWRAEGESIEPTRYRTELGAALRYTLQARDTLTARRETVRCYLKVYRDDRGERTLHLLRGLSERAGAGSYAAVRPLAYWPDVRTLVLEEAPGTALQQLLLEDRDPFAAAGTVARAVAAFNQDDSGITRRQSVADQLEDVRLAASLVAWACPDVSDAVAEITAAVVEGLDDAPPAPIHGDLKTDHVFLSGDRVTFIDLDSAALGDPVRDPAHLFAYITSQVGLEGMPPERARAVAAAFVEAYFRHVPTPWRRRFPLHCAGALIEVASGMFRRQDPQWQEKVAAAVAEARTCLSWRAR